jgi:P-type Ca2+ transporter type 2C
MHHVQSLAVKGRRVIGVATAAHGGKDLPVNPDDFDWEFEGLVGFFDPPKQNVRKVFEKLYVAGIDVKLVTGDFPETAIAICQETGLQNNGRFMTGEQVMQLSPAGLNESLKGVSVYARMFPEAKLKLIEALKDAGDIVAMTGDGVNDGPALKSADIGIAMGEKGTDLARQSADLILTDDNLEKVVEAIEQGRKIFSNLKKSFRYIISIHIPIILTASLPLVLGWKYPNIFTPIHIIFLELIMGPTCSIFYEREPVEDYIMKLPPRSKTLGIFQKSEILISVIQGLVIALGILLLYYLFMERGAPLQLVRTVVFTTLILSNILLTFVNRSFTQSVWTALHYKNNLVLPVFGISVCFLASVLLWPFLRNLFGLGRIGSSELMACLVTASISVFWFELYKALRLK